MDLQNKFLQKVGIDKILHFAFGGWTSSLFFILMCLWIKAESLMFLLILSFGFALGVMKELIDKYIRRSSFDWKDVLATFLGSVLTILILTLILIFTSL